MLPNQRFIRECKAWGLFVLGIAALLLGLIRWPHAGFPEHFIVLTFTPLIFAGSCFHGRNLLSRRQKTPRVQRPAVTRMNPTADLPPMRRR
jgi:hypothetical protein